MSLNVKLDDVFIDRLVDEEVLLLGCVHVSLASRRDVVALALSDALHPFVLFLCFTRKASLPVHVPFLAANMLRSLHVVTVEI